MSHVVRINYYPPRGTIRRMGQHRHLRLAQPPMQIKVDFLCRDSILAAPIVLDLILFLDLAKRTSELRGRGIREWLSFFSSSR
jgi:myo-inositol-1-phosphate synthase